MLDTKQRPKDPCHPQTPEQQPRACAVPAWPEGLATTRVQAPFPASGQGQAEAGTSCQSSHREGQGSLGLHWFLAGTCAHLVLVSLLYHRQKHHGGQSVSSSLNFLDISTAQESMLQASPLTAGGTGQASRQERGMKAGLSLTQGLV